VKHPTFLDLPTMLVNCISLIVAYVPLGLPVSVTLTLSLIAAKASTCT
jgi:sodium/potassium-transporting ATPase subunit alpha